MTLTFSISPPANPTTSARPPHTIHFRASDVRAENVASDRSMRWPLTHTQTWRSGRTFNTTDWVICNVHPASTSDLQNLLLPAVFRVVDGVVCAAHRPCDIELGRRCTSDHACTKRYMRMARRSGRSKNTCTRTLQGITHLYQLG